MKGYGKYIGKKIGWYALTLVVAVFLNFLLPRLIPGNPVDVMVSEMAAGMTDANAIKKLYESYNAQFGLDKTLPEQFFIYVKNLLKGDLGVSFGQYPRPVTNILATAAPWTIMLQLPAILLGWLLGNVLGAVASYRKGIWDKVIFPTFLFLSAIPSFAMAIVLVWVFANTFKILPGSLAYSYDMSMNWSSWPFIKSVIRHYQLPFWSIVLVSIGGQSLGMREMSIYELNADYVKYSRLMGVKDNKIVTYVFRNAMLPQITGLALAIGSMLGGSLVAETVFSYPGIGTTMFAAIRTQDFPLISGCTLVITLTVLAANFLVDVLYGFIDPRIRTNQQEET